MSKPHSRLGHVVHGARIYSRGVHFESKQYVARGRDQDGTLGALLSQLRQSLTVHSLFCASLTGCCLRGARGIQQDDRLLQGARAPTRADELALLRHMFPRSKQDGGPVCQHYAPLEQVWP